MLKPLVEKLDSMWEQMDNVSRDMKSQRIKRECYKSKTLQQKWIMSLMSSSVDWKQLRK